MSRFIAEFIMRGRPQAILVALLGAWVPFLSQASLGLVTLRRGWLDGGLICFWALLPVLGVIWFDNIIYSFLVLGLGAIVVTYVSAGVLRNSVSLSYSVWFSVVIAILFSVLGMALLGDELGQEFSSFFEHFLSQQKATGQVDSASLKEFEDFVANWSAIQTSGVIAFGIAFSGLIGLLVSRWWQAILYNPGGFQKEFHELRFKQLETILVVVPLGLCISLGEDFQFWLMVFALPPLLVGLGLVHSYLKGRPQAVFFMVIIYFTLAVLPLARILIVVIALTDTWLDYRKKFNIRQ